MGKLVFKSNIQELTPAHLQVAEQKLLAFIHSNPEAKKLLDEATHNRDVTIRIDNQEHPFGAHWDKEAGEVVLFLSGINFAEMTSEQLATLLEEDFKDANSKAYAVIFELCNSVNAALNKPLSFIEFAETDEYAEYMESLEFGSYQRAAAIYQYGHQHCGWPEFQPLDIECFENYFHQLQQSEKGALHIEYYANDFIRKITNANAEIEKLGIAYKVVRELFMKAIKNHHESFFGFVERVRSLSCTFAEVQISEMYKVMRKQAYQLELDTLNMSYKLVESVYDLAIKKSEELKKAATLTQREASVELRQYKRYLLSTIEDAEKTLQQNFNQFNKDYVSQHDTVHENFKAITEIELNTRSNMQLLLEERHRKHQIALVAWMKQMENNRQENTDLTAGVISGALNALTNLNIKKQDEAVSIAPGNKN